MEWADLAGALRYSITVEVATQPVLDQRRLNTLRYYIETVLSFLPHLQPATRRLARAHQARHKTLSGFQVPSGAAGLAPADGVHLPHPHRVQSQAGPAHRGPSVTKLLCNMLIFLTLYSCRLKASRFKPN